MSRHTSLIDAVNDATTEYDRTYASGVLEGWRLAQKESGRGWSFIEADEHTESRFGDRPICCGILLDWKPTDTGAAS